MLMPESSDIAHRRNSTSKLTEFRCVAKRDATASSKRENVYDPPRDQRLSDDAPTDTQSGTMCDPNRIAHATRVAADLSDDYIATRREAFLKLEAPISASKRISGSYLLRPRDLRHAFDQRPSAFTDVFEPRFNSLHQPGELPFRVRQQEPVGIQRLAGGSSNTACAIASTSARPPFRIASMLPSVI